MSIKSNMQDNSPITFGVVAGILGAAWTVIVANGLLDGLSPEGRDSVTALVLLVIPIVAAIIAQRFTTSLSSPNLPIGTVVNERTGDPTGVVVEGGDGPSNGS